MTIKYKLGFTIDSQTLFGIMAKFLPIENLTVEEVPVIERQLKRADLPELLHNLHKPKPVRHKKAPRGSGYAVNIYAGVNAIIMAAMADGKPHTLVDSHANIVAAGYSPNGLYSRVQRLVKHGYIIRVRSGYYQLTPKGKTAWAERPFPELKVEDRA
jgi:hypothetical protein